MAQQNFVAMSTSQAYSQQQQPPSLYSMNSVNMSLQQPPLPPPPQQQPLQTPVGQANQVPFNMFNQQQTQYGMQQAAQQQTPSQQQMAPGACLVSLYSIPLLLCASVSLIPMFYCSYSCYLCTPSAHPVLTALSQNMSFFCLSFCVCLCV